MLGLYPIRTEMDIYEIYSEYLLHSNLHIPNWWVNKIPGTAPRYTVFDWNKGSRSLLPLSVQFQFGFEDAVDYEP